MRKRIIVSGALLGAAGLMFAAGPANAANPTQTLTNSTAPLKQDVKKYGGVSLTTAVDTFYTGADAPSATCPAIITTCRFFPPANRTVLDFDNDYKFRTGTITPCTVNLVPQTTDGARAACPRSIVGQGSSVIRTLTGGTLNAVVTAFVGGPNVLLLHADPGPTVTSKPVLTGTLGPSPLGGDFGQRLDVTVPVTSGTAITHFDTTINKVVSIPGKKAKKAKKGKKGTKKKPPTFLASMRCADKDRTLNITETTSFGPNQTTVTEQHTASSTQTCAVKKPKPKKKKGTK